MSEEVKTKENIVYFRNLAIVLTITSTVCGFIAAYLGDIYPGQYDSMRIMLGIKCGIGNMIALCMLTSFFRDNAKVHGTRY